MLLTPYVLIDPVSVQITKPGRDDEPAQVKTFNVTQLDRRPIGANTYFSLGGEVTFVANSTGGGSYEVELDDKIDAYLNHCFNDPEKPETALALKALRLPDALRLRQEIIDTLDEAADRAWKARKNAKPLTLTLLDPIDWHNKVVREVGLQWPTHAAFRKFGKPFSRSRMADGAVQYLERVEVVEKYIEGCVDEEYGRYILGKMSLADAFQLKMAIMGFFTQAVGIANGRTKSMPSSLEENSSPSVTQTA